MVHDIEDCRWDCPTVEIGAELSFLGVLNLGVVYQDRCSVSVVMRVFDCHLRPSQKRESVITVTTY
jgi:hypothetical protein